MSDVNNFALGLLCGGAVVGIGTLCYYGSQKSSKIEYAENSQDWPKYVRDRIKKTFNYLCGSVALTAGTAFLVYRSPKLMNFIEENPELTFLGLLGGSLGSLHLCLKTSYSKQSINYKHITWGLFCGTFGIMLAPAGKLGGPLLLEASLYTGGIVCGFAAVAACAPDRRFITWGGTLSMGLSTMTVSSILSLFFSKTSSIGEALDFWLLYGGLGLFSLYILYDTQVLIDRVEKHPLNDPEAPFDPINYQFELFLDALNIFIRVVKILVRMEEEKRKKEERKKKING